MYSAIVIPTDGSRHAEAAAKRACRLASSFDATVHIVAVVDTGLFGSVRLPGDAGSATSLLTEEAEGNVQHLADIAREMGLEVQTDIRDGTPVDEILDYIEDHGADVVVMGSRGRGGIDRMVLGSVTEGVIRYSETDVLVVGDQSDGE